MHQIFLFYLIVIYLNNVKDWMFFSLVTYVSPPGPGSGSDCWDDMSRAPPLYCLVPCPHVLGRDVLQIIGQYAPGTRDNAQMKIN